MKLAAPVALIAAAVIGVASTADAATPTSRTVTLKTTTQTFQTTIGPTASVSLYKTATGMQLRIRRSDGSVDAFGVTGFKSLFVSTTG